MNDAETLQQAKDEIRGRKETVEEVRIDEDMEKVINSGRAKPEAAKAYMDRKVSGNPGLQERLKLAGQPWRKEMEQAHSEDPDGGGEIASHFQVGVRAFLVWELSVGGWEFDQFGSWNLERWALTEPPDLSNTLKRRLILSSHCVTNPSHPPCEG